MAFYAAVHCVNAYLWESQRYEPGNHGDRSRGVRSDPQLRPCRASYDLLRDRAYHARYTETFTLPEQDARHLIGVAFRRVEATVMVALGQPIPIW